MRWVPVSAGPSSLLQGASGAAVAIDREGSFADVAYRSGGQAAAAWPSTQVDGRPWRAAHGQTSTRRDPVETNGRAVCSSESPDCEWTTTARASDDRYRWHHSGITWRGGKVIGHESNIDGDCYRRRQSSTTWRGSATDHGMSTNGDCCRRRQSSTVQCDGSDADYDVSASGGGRQRQQSCTTQCQGHDIGYGGDRDRQRQSGTELRESNTKLHEHVSANSRWAPPSTPSPLKWAMARQPPAAGRREHMNCIEAIHPASANDRVNGRAHISDCAHQMISISCPDACRHPGDDATQSRLSTSVEPLPGCSSEFGRALREKRELHLRRNEIRAEAHMMRELMRRAECGRVHNQCATVSCIGEACRSCALRHLLMCWNCSVGEFQKFKDTPTAAAAAAEASHRSDDRFLLGIYQ